jgi:hypothetical protein
MQVVNLHMRKILLITGLVGTILAGGALVSQADSGSTVSAGSGQAPVPPVDNSHLDLVARAIATHYGESHPTNIQRVAGLQRAEAIAKLTGETVENASGIADVLQEHGEFRAPSAPPEEPAPKGHVLTVIVSRETGLITDISLAEGANPGQDLSQLGGGPPVALP